MGSLNPGATYIYERDGGTVYAREFGSKNRKIIGMDYPPLTKEQVEEEMKSEMMWKDIRRKAESNPTLKSALDRAIMIYKLSEDKIT